MGAFRLGIPNLQPAGYMWPSRPIHATLHPTLKIFSSSFDFNCEEVPLQLQMELIDIQCSEDSKSVVYCRWILRNNKERICIKIYSDISILWR